MIERGVAEFILFKDAGIGLNVILKLLQTGNLSSKNRNNKKLFTYNSTAQKYLFYRDMVRPILTDHIDFCNSMQWDGNLICQL